MMVGPDGLLLTVTIECQFHFFKPSKIISFLALIQPEKPPKEPDYVHLQAGSSTSETPTHKTVSFNPRTSFEDGPCPRPCLSMTSLVQFKLILSCFKCQSDRNFLFRR